MRVLRALSPLIVAIGIAAMATPAHATGSPAIVGITVTSLQGDCSAPSVCVQVTLNNPEAGTIVLKLTGHTPGSSVFVDTGAPNQTLQVDASHTTYTICFGDVTQFVSGKGFNTLRVEVASASAGITGTDTKSRSFSLCGQASPTPSPSESPSPTPSPSTSPSPSPTPSSTPSESPSPGASSSPTPTSSSTPGQGGGGGTASPTPTPSMTASAALAMTGGLDGRLLLAGLALLVAGLALFLVARARKEAPGPSR
jgi:hypothetical protein